MSTSIKLILDRRRAKDDGSFPVGLQLIHNRVKICMLTGYYALPDEWIQASQTIETKKITAKELKVINGILHKKRADANAVIFDLEKFGELEKLSVTEVKSKIANKSSNVTFKKYTEKIIEDFKKINKLGNASVYKQAIDFIDRHTNKKEYTFQQINFNLLKHLETQHLSKGNTINSKKLSKDDSSESEKKVKPNSLNSLSFYMRTIRAIYNRAMKEGIVKREFYPFDKYIIRETETEKRSISKEDINRIRDLKLEPGTNIWHARNYFMFSFYNMGMNFADIAYLKMDNLIDGRIEYIRAKTGKPYSIKISEPVQAILDIYINGKKKDDYLFPIISRESPEDKMKDMQNGRHTCDKWLKEIGTTLGLQLNLTTYVSRHSWANIAQDLGVNDLIITEGLGQSDYKTTQIYLRKLKKNIIDDANQLVIK